MIAALRRLVAWLRETVQVANTATRPRPDVKNTSSARTGSIYANTGYDAAMDRPIGPRPGYENPDRHPARHEAAQRMSTGPWVLVPREVANFAENLLVTALARDTLSAVAPHYDFQMMKAAGCRQALSDAIEAADRSGFLRDATNDMLAVDATFRGLTEPQATTAVQATSAPARVVPDPFPGALGRAVLIEDLDVPGALAVLAAITRAARP